MEIKDKKIPLQMFVVAIVVFIITVLGGIIYSAVIKNVENIITVSQEKNIKREIQSLENGLFSYFNTMEIILRETSNSPVVLQGVMQPEYSIDNMKDYLDDFTILNEKYNITATDFNGKVLYSNALIRAVEYNKLEWVENLSDGKLESYKGVSNINNTYYWTLGIPITYNESTEGALIVEIPLEKIYKAISIYDILGGIQLDIMKDSKSLLTIGEVQDGWVKSEFIPELGLDLKFTVNSSDSVILLKRLKSNILGVLLSFIFITVLVLILVSKKFVISPLKKLGERMDQFKNSGTEENFETTIVVDEINQLSEHFLDMIRIIRRREGELKISEHELLENNEELKSIVDVLESTQSIVIQQEKLASIGRLAAGVAHELNNPIGFVSSNFAALKDYVPIIVNYIEALKSDDNNAKKQVNMREINYILEDIPELISESDEGLQRVTEIVQNLKNYSRIDRIKSNKYDLNNGVETTLMIAKNEYKYIAKIDLELGEIPEITANGSEINEVILNILVNASQALAEYNTDEDKIIGVKTYLKESNVYCEIEDNGPGIENDIMENIFDPFFTTKEPGKGTGLGLNIAYNIVKNKHNGEILVESELDKGTKFIVVLPVDGED